MRLWSDSGPLEIPLPRYIGQRHQEAPLWAQWSPALVIIRDKDSFTQRHKEGKGKKPLPRNWRKPPPSTHPKSVSPLCQLQSHMRLCVLALGCQELIRSTVLVSWLPKRQNDLNPSLAEGAGPSSVPAREGKAAESSYNDNADTERGGGVSTRDCCLSDVDTTSTTKGNKPSPLSSIRV